MTNQSPSYYHTTIIPVTQAALWLLGLLLSVFGTSFMIGDAANPTTIALFNVLIVFGIFLFEVALSFSDMAAEYSDKRIRGNVFWVLTKVFIIIPLTLIFSLLTYKYSIYFLIPLILLLTLLKWQIAHLNNNMHKFVIDVEGFSYVSARLN